MTPDSPWTRCLSAQSSTFDPSTFAIEFGDPRAALRIAREGCIAVPLVHLGALLVSGEEAATLLHNLLSNDVRKLAEDRAQHNSFNNPKGRMLANFLIWRGAEGYRLTLSADIAAAIQKKLSMYVLRAKAKVADVSAERALIGLCGKADAALQAAGLPHPADPLSVSMCTASTAGTIHVVRLDPQRMIIDAPASIAPAIWDALAGAGAVPTGTLAWQWFDVVAGVPLITATNQDEFVAQMLNFELIGGVDFKKGCYPGQEIVARTQYLGKLKKRMYRAHFDGEAAPPVNADLYSPAFGDQSCGKVVSVAPAPDTGFDLLAVLQITARDSGEVHMGAPDGARLEFAELPYTVD